MTDGTFGGGDGAYTGTGGAYATVEADPTIRYDNFEWGGPLSDRYEVKSPDGEITKDVSYNGEYGVKSGMDNFLVWAHPQEVHDEQNRRPRGKHDYYAQKGDEMASVMRLTGINDGSTWVAFPLSFGQTYTYHWHRYKVNPVYRDRFRVVGWTRDGYDIIADSGKGAVDWSSWLDTWLVFVAKWYHPDKDGRTGVRALFFPADDFPFGDFTLAKYDAGDFGSLSAVSDIDTADHHRGDRDKWFDDNARHRFGFGSTENCSTDHDDIMLLDRPE